MASLVDLHTHTTASDGRLSPAELLTLAAELGIRYLAIADHDTTSGFEAARTLARSNLSTPEIIPAVEVSAEGPLACHILGYFIDAADPDFQRNLAHHRVQRLERMKRMIDRVAALGMPVTLERVTALAKGGTLGRPHLADAMVEMGFVRSRQEAFDRYLSNSGPVHTVADAPTAEEVIRLIRRAGGVPVLAHPAFHSEESFIKNLAELGLMGLEVYYPEHGKSLTAKFIDLAKRYGLIVTGGSDFHGPKTGRGALGCVDVPLEVIDHLRAAKSKAAL